MRYVFLYFLQSREQGPYHIIILRDGDSKGSKVQTQFTKVSRQKMAHSCTIDSLGLWLLTRFEITKEYKVFYFNNNNSWVNIKILSITLVKKKGLG